MIPRSPRATPLIIGGMPRSGTTLLQLLCNRHPQMRITKEFGNYAFIGDSLSSYMRRTAKRIQYINGRWRLLGTSGRGPSPLVRSMNHAANVRIASGHLVRLARNGGGPVTLTAMAEARRNNPKTLVVGDKFPNYIFMMDRFVELSGLLRLVIYRDCRDVTSSYLLMTRTKWRDQAWIHDSNTAEKIARRWVHAIEIMERHANRLFPIRYESLVGDPLSELRRIAEWLGVDPSGFIVNRVSDSSVGKYKQGLEDEELEDVLRIAGPTLERLNYH